MEFYKSKKSLKISFTSIIFALFLLFVMAGNNGIKNYLNELIFDSVLSRTNSEIKRILPNYFNFLQNTAFWIEAGDFPEPGNNQANTSLLQHGVLGTMPGTTALKYIKGNKGTSFTYENGEVVTNLITDIENYKNRYPVERKNDLKPDNLFNENLFITDLYELDSSDELGYSIILEINSVPPVSLSLDISLVDFAQSYQHILSRNAIFFSTLNPDKIIIFPLNSNHIKNSAPENNQVINKNIEYLKPLIKTALEESKSNQVNKSYFVNYNGKKWLYLPFLLNNYGGTIGILVPESELFFSQFDKLYIMASIPFFLMFILLSSLYLFSRYREKNQITEEQQLLHLIGKGESKKLEFKSSLRWDYRENILNKKLEEVVLKTIAAFGNGYGGTLLIGIDDDGTVLGLTNDYNTLKHPGKDGFELHLRNLISAMYGTFSIKNTDIKFITVNDHEICQITISESTNPLFTIMKNKTGDTEQFYIRDGNLSRRIESLNEIIKYCNKRFKK